MDTLLAALLVLLALGAVTALVVLVVIALGARALSRRNRVSPDVPTPAPTSWLAAPTAPARLHRRLRSAVAVARAAAASPGANPQLADIARELESEAVALDGHVVVTARMPTRDRRAHSAALSARIREVERLAGQLSVEAAQAQAHRVAAGQPTALDQLAEQLDALEQARREVAQIEADAGIDRVSPYAVPEAETRRAQPGT